MTQQNTSFRRRAVSTFVVLGAAALFQGSLASASAAPAYGLYNTGIDTAAMMFGSTPVEEDLAYTVAMEGGTLPSSNLYVTDLGTFPNALPYSPPDDATSSFISVQPSYANHQVDAGGEYDFTTTFTLTASTVTTASIFGSFESDDRIDDVLVNGHSLGISLSDPDYKGFSPFFNLVNSNDLVVGTNTLTFRLFNFPNSDTDPVALRTVFSAVPEPSTWTMFGGLALVTTFGSWMRRRGALA